MLFPAGNEYPDWPTDEYALEQWKISMLNRIDQEWGCDVILNKDEIFYPAEYCECPEHDPFTNRCWDHTPGNLSSGHM
jgi:hypothetical protein